MAAGGLLYDGLALPAYGEALMTQTTGATDILTIQGANAQTGDFLNLRDSTETERFSVEDGGNLVITQKAAADVGLVIKRATGPTANGLTISDNGGSATKRFGISANYTVLMRFLTTRPTTGLTKGEMAVFFHTTTPKIGVVWTSASAASSWKLVRLKTKTFGRLTA